MRKTGKLVLWMLALGLQTSMALLAESQGLAGSWRGAMLLRPAEIELDLELTLTEDSEGSLQGTVCYPLQGPQQHPIKILTSAGHQLSFQVQGDDGVLSSFKATLQEKGDVMEGELAEGNQTVFFELHREGKVTSPLSAGLQTLSPDLGPLKAAFDQDKGKVRLLMILAPTCGSCKMAARLIERYVLASNPNPGLRAYVIWEGISPHDTKETAEAASSLLSDPRIRQFWSAEKAAGSAFRQSVGVRGSVAWDVFLLFPRDRMWTAPVPAFSSFMHNLTGHDELPRDRLLNGARLDAEVRQLLTEPDKELPSGSN